MWITAHKVCYIKSMKTELERICIRAKVDGKWDSPTLEELYAMGGGGQVFEWALGKLNSMEGVALTRENLEAFVKLIQDFGVTIVKLKQDHGA